MRIGECGLRNHTNTGKPSHPFSRVFRMALKKILKLRNKPILSIYDLRLPICDLQTGSRDALPVVLP
jgi:hypothetical protein